MDVKTVCLGLLTNGPASGYDLKKFFESTFGHFFAAGFGSIYPALNTLAEQGLVACEEVPQEGKPDRKVYSITEDGRRELMQALENAQPTHKVRSEFLATLFFAHLMSAEQTNAVLDHRIADIDAFVEFMDGVDMGTSSCWPAGARFVAGFGLATAKAAREYIESHRQLLVDDEEQTLKSAHG